MFQKEKLDNMPPAMVRLIARKPDGRRRPMTNAEIAEASGLSEDRVKEISMLTTWDDVPVGETYAFCSGCGVTYRNYGEHLWYIKRSYKGMQRPLAHLRNLPDEERSFISDLTHILSGRSA